MPLTLGVDGRTRALDAALGKSSPALLNGTTLYIGLLENLPITYATDSLEDLVGGNEFAVDPDWYAERVTFPWGDATELGGYAESRVQVVTEGGWSNATGGDVTVEGMFITDSADTSEDAAGSVLAVGPVSGAPLVIANGDDLFVRHLSIAVRVVA